VVEAAKEWGEAASNLEYMEHVALGSYAGTTDAECDEDTKRSSLREAINALIEFENPSPEAP
jgi:hypothetical protein